MPRFNWTWTSKTVGGETVKFREPTSRRAGKAKAKPKKRGKSKGGKKKGKGSKGRARASSRTRRLSSSRITNPARMLSSSSSIPRSGGSSGRKKKRGTAQLVLIS